MEQRENVVRNGLGDWHLENGYVRVHAVKALSKSEVYAAVSYEKRGERFVTYAAVSLACRRKGDGHWLSAECFLAAESTPPHLSNCPDEIFAAGKATGFTPMVEPAWLAQCVLSTKVKANTAALKKGQIFTLDSNAPGLEIGVEEATFAIVRSKKTVTLIAPLTGTSKEAAAQLVLPHYSPIPSTLVPTFTETSGYNETEELLFDLSGSAPKLKGRLAAGAKAALLARARQVLAEKLGAAAQSFDFASGFTTGAWLA